MKLSGMPLLSLAALLTAVHADFEIYQVGIGGNGITGNAEGWQVYQDEANCDTVLEWIWRDSDDVSGGKYGVRCEGDGCERGWEWSDHDPANIDIMEMNFNRDEHHWSKEHSYFMHILRIANVMRSSAYYKDREGGLYDLSNNKVGRCYPWPAAMLDCGITVARVQGHRKLRCEIGVNAGDINGGRPT
jgi:hypothetical protein